MCNDMGFGELWRLGGAVIVVACIVVNLLFPPKSRILLYAIYTKQAMPLVSVFFFGWS